MLLTRSIFPSLPVLCSGSHPLSVSACPMLYFQPLSLGCIFPLTCSDISYDTVTCYKRTSRDKNKQKEIACGDTMRGSGLMFAIKGWHFHVCMEGALVQRCPQLRWVWDLMPDDLRWSWCKNNRNKVHDKCNVLESSWNHPLPSLWKNSLLRDQPLMPKRLQTDAPVNPASDGADRHGSSLAKITLKAHGAGVLEREYSFANFYLFLQFFFQV